MNENKKIVFMVIAVLGLFLIFFVSQKISTTEGMTYSMEVSGNQIEIDACYNTVNGTTMTVDRTITLPSSSVLTSSSSSYTSSGTVNVYVNVPTTFYGTDGTVTYIENNYTTITVTASNGTTYTYTTDNTSTTDITKNTFYGSNGGFCKVYSDGTNYFIEVQPPNGSMYFLTSNNPGTPASIATLGGVGGGGVGVQLGAGGLGLSNPYAPYPDTTGSLFMLKSEMVPPVCPRCPDVNPGLVADAQMYEKNQAQQQQQGDNPVVNDANVFNNPQPASANEGGPKKYRKDGGNCKECRPCKPCGRCPEPNFECKKVPNYEAIRMNDPTMIPLVGMTDYSTFGN
jgi:hypothetical protein